MAQGDHIYVRRGRRYSHHGIDCGDGSVIHYAGKRGTTRYVARTSLETFADGSPVHVRSYPSRLGVERTVHNAESRIGSVGYHLVKNNCEHFAAWCCTGRAASSQVRRWVFAGQGALGSLVAGLSIGAHAAVLSSVGLGVYALAHPRRRRRHEHTSRVVAVPATPSNSR